MRTLRGLALAILLTGPEASAAANADLVRAQQLVRELKYEEADRALEAAAAVAGNDRETVLALFELRGLVAATLHDSDRAAKYFRLLLTLNPEHQLSGEPTPRVSTPFFEARSWVADHGVLEFAMTGPERAEVRSDPLRLAVRVRFHGREPNGTWRTVEQPVLGGEARASFGFEARQSWAELLGLKGAVLAGADWGAPKGKDSPLAALPPATVLDGSTGPSGVVSGRPMRAAAYVALGLGIASAVAAAVEGQRSNDLRRRIERASRDESGVVVGMTQREATQVEGQARIHATVANVLFAAAGTLAVTGGLVWLFSVPEPAGER